MRLERTGYFSPEQSLLFWLYGGLVDDLHRGVLSSQFVHALAYYGKSAPTQLLSDNIVILRTKE